jgi:hypothetical protein
VSRRRRGCTMGLPWRIGASHEEAEELTKQFCATLRAYAARLDEEDR